MTGRIKDFIIVEHRSGRTNKFVADQQSRVGIYTTETREEVSSHETYMFIFVIVVVTGEIEIHNL
jgi:hypothetical protein